MRNEFEKSYAKIHMGGATADNLESIAYLRNGESYDNESLAKAWEACKEKGRVMAFDEWVKGMDW